VRFPIWATGITLAAAALAASLGADNWKPERLTDEGLPNAYRLHARVISGGEPDGEPAFAALKKLGIKTIISVDGARPNLALAEKYGLRYAHLPHGYDGVPDQRIRELAKAVRDLPGPVYIHCHHGKHRSPAAAAVACVATGLLDSDRALVVLQTAGTSENYRGLYQSVRTVQRIDDKSLDQLAADFPAQVKISPIADAMVQIEHAHDHLKAFAESRWQPLPRQPDLDAAHEALLFKEHYVELARTPEVQKMPAAFRKLLSKAESEAGRLEDSLQKWQRSGQPSPPPANLNAVLAAITKNCTACHQQFRDVPLAEKRR
jgi:protein tyrosine phosphatase (PTP) superfamily phosphohydrolase (DUF442 family)